MVEISTEQAVTFFALTAGIGGGLAQILAGRRLSQVPGDTVPLRKLIIPTAVAGLSTAIAPILLPAGPIEPIENLEKGIEQTIENTEISG